MSGMLPIENGGQKGGGEGGKKECSEQSNFEFNHSVKLSYIKDARYFKFSQRVHVKSGLKNTESSKMIFSPFFLFLFSYLLAVDINFIFLSDVVTEILMLGIKSK